MLQKTTTAKQENEDAKELELIQLAVSAAQVAGEGVITTENLNDELSNNLNETAEAIGDNWYYKDYIIYKDGHIEISNGNLHKYIKQDMLVHLDAVENYNKYGSNSQTWYNLLGQSNNAILKTGQAIWTNKGLVLNGNTCYDMDSPVDNSFGTVEVCVLIDDTFHPNNSLSWFRCSAIFGCELADTQRDWAILIDKDSKFGIGYSTGTVYSSNIFANDNKVHTITYSHMAQNLKFAIDGNIITSINYTSTGESCTKFGIGYDKYSYKPQYDTSGELNTIIKGNIYSVRFYNRELTDSEIKNNYNVDIQRFR